MSHKNEYGCLMAVVNWKFADKITTLGNKLIKTKNLFEDPNDDSYGRDDEPHVTLLFGFTSNMPEDAILHIANKISQFYINLKSISIFENDKYDVVKFDVEKSDILIKLNKICKLYPHVSKYPEYHPHLTIAYVKKGTFKNKNIYVNKNVLIDRLKWNGQNDDSTRYFKLKNQ
jgi:2'-5' RNA ligase